MIARKAATERRPTIIDVARAANVGVMTVSRVINNYATVRPKTRAKVMSAIERVGYRPNDAARMLKGMRGRTIGLIVPDMSDFFASCFHAIQVVAMARSYQTLVVVTGRDAAVEKEQLASIENYRVAGLIIVPSGNNGPQIQILQKNGIPVVALDRPIHGAQTDALVVENREGAEQGTQHLIEHGHKRIVCLAFDSEVFTVRERLDGYRQAMFKGRLESQLCANIQSLQMMEEQVRSWARSKDRPTAVFSAQRITSIRLIQALCRSGLRVPEDIAIVAFDDFELAEALGTPLTVVGQSAAQLATVAAEMLFKHIDTLQHSPAAELQPVRLVYPTKMIIRSSCGCNPVDVKSALTPVISERDNRRAKQPKGRQGSPERCASRVFDRDRIGD